MKNDKDNYYFKEIIKCLLSGEIVSTSSIADLVGLSDKSIRNKIDEINNYLMQNNLGTIEKKRRIGVWLEMNDSQKQKLEQIVSNYSNIRIKYDENERVYEVLKKLFFLRPFETISTQKLADCLYLSAPTVLKIIKKCELWLNVYNIQIINEKNMGYRLSYNEDKYRIAFKNFIMENADTKKIQSHISYFFYNIDTYLIQKAIIEVENEWNYRFTDESFYEVFIYCCLAYQRINMKLPRIADAHEFELIQKYNEYPFTIAIFNKLQNKFHILFSNEDVVFLTIQIMCSKFIHIKSMDETLSQVKKYDNNLVEFVTILLRNVGNILEIELESDAKLKDSLIIHLRSTIFRLRQGATQKNSLLGTIKKSYKNSFRAVLSMCLIFEDFFGFQLTENEVGYITLYIQSAIERKNKQYRLLLLSDYSKGYIELLSERIRKQIPEVSKISIMSSHDFKLYGNEDADIILTSREIEISDKRLIIVPDLLSETGIVYLRTQLESLNADDVNTVNPISPICFPLFNPEFIFVKQKYDNKQQLLEKLCNKLEQSGYVSSQFYNSVLERENATSTAIGNGISLTHGAVSEVNECKICIALLDSPILWNDEYVDIVFLLAFKMNTSEENKIIQTFYKDYIKLIDNENNLKKLRNFNTNLELYKYLIS